MLNLRFSLDEAANLAAFLLGRLSPFLAAPSIWCRSQLTAMYSRCDIQLLTFDEQKAIARPLIT